MTEHMVVKATLQAFKHTPSNDEVKIILVVPAGNGLDAIQKLGGFPKAGESRWCAIAVLNENNQG